MIILRYDDTKLSQAIQRFGAANITKLIVASLELRANEARREAVQTFIGAGIGKGIWGARGFANAYKLITLDKVTSFAKLSVKGLAALQEQGGRIRAHPIPRRGKLNRKPMLFYSSGGGKSLGGMQFAWRVNHPGANVRRIPALVPAAERAQANVVLDLKAKLDALWAGKAA